MLTLSHLIVSHYSSMSLGKVHLLAKMLVQVLAEVSRWQERLCCSAFYLGFCSSSMSEILWNSCKVSVLTWNSLTGESSIEVPVRKMNTYFWENISDSAALVLLIVWKWELRHEREDLLTAGDTRMAMQLKKDHGLEQLWGKETLHYLRWASGRSKAYCIMPLCIFCPRNSFMSVHSRWHFN